MKSLVDFTLRVFADPELKYANSGMAFVSIKCSKPNGKNKNAKLIDPKTGTMAVYNPSMWIEVIAFEELAESASSTFEKGSYIDVKGRLTMEGWVGKDGNMGQSIKIIANDIVESVKEDYSGKKDHKSCRDDVDDAPF